ncbi:hypothetical protein SAMN05216251_117139 [Actinacidiphila alni]|uniref:Uncharacterized protein n=1 Tax=Actinacidiphila alni TaxID=380248 RepID=A0A1I2JCL2_9ACTN|nr:hypothetical protein SAMN05216251_117139 [Actinacidiphila alni]
MTEEPTPPTAPRRGPTWPTPSGPPAGPEPRTAPAANTPNAPNAVKKRHPVLTHGAVALVAVVIGVGIGNSGGSPGDGKQATTSAPSTSTATVKPKATAKPGPRTSFAGDGEYLVGDDIAAGTYRTAGPQDGIPCYWERDKDSSGSFASIIANDTVSGTGRVTLRKGEVFKTERCTTWKKVG